MQRFKDLITEMRAVARGEVAATPDGAMPSVESAEALLRLLTPDNRSLLRTIRDAKPHLLRTLGKLEAFGLLEMRSIGRRRVPTTLVGMLRVDIDPYAMADRIEAGPANR